MARPSPTELTLLAAIQEMDQREDPEIGYPPVATAMSLMPGTKLPVSVRAWAKTSGPWAVSWTAGTNPRNGEGYGLPGGGKGRLLVAYLAGRALRNNDPMIELGLSEAGFMRDLGMAASGGKGNSKALVGEMALRLVRSNIVAEKDADPSKYDGGQGDGIRIAQSYSLWWARSENTTHPTAGSYILLDPLFWQLIQDHPLPLNLDALRILAGSALAQDLYSWLTYRLRQLEHPITVSWEHLTQQFGTKGLPPVNAPNSGRSRAISETKRNIRKQMPTVLAVYHKAKVIDTDRGLELHPSVPHVPQKGMHAIHRAAAAASYPSRRKAATEVAGQMTLGDDTADQAPIKVRATVGVPAPELPAPRRTGQAS